MTVPIEYEWATCVVVRAPGLGDGGCVTRHDMDEGGRLFETVCHVFRVAGSDFVCRRSPWKSLRRTGRPRSLIGGTEPGEVANLLVRRCLESAEDPRQRVRLAER